MSNMKAVQIEFSRVSYSEVAFAELVIWKLSKPVSGSDHGYKYRLAYIVNGTCVLRYDNESGKGDHRHYGDSETVYVFDTPEKLRSDFLRDIERWNRENSDS